MIWFVLMVCTTADLSAQKKGLIEGYKIIQKIVRVPTIINILLGEHMRITSGKHVGQEMTWYSKQIKEHGREKEGK